MSAERKRKYQLITEGYIKSLSGEYNLDIPSEIVSIIFIFHFIQIFNIRHGKKISADNNIITNIAQEEDDESWLTQRNNKKAVIGQWMRVNSDFPNTHTIKLKIVKDTGGIGIGIVSPGYKLESPLRSYHFRSHGAVHHNQGKRIIDKRVKDTFSTGDIVTLTLNSNPISLSYSIIKTGDKEPARLDVPKKGILFEKFGLSEYTFKWAVEIDERGDCVEIIDIFSARYDEIVFESRTKGNGRKVKRQKRKNDDMRRRMLQPGSLIAMDFDIDSNTDQEEQTYSFRKRVQYVTLVGAVCCVTVLVGYILYSRNNANGDIGTITKGNKK